MKHLSLCTGYGGIDMALTEVFGAETVAVADIDPGACKILAHRYPDVPNLGDITTVDWSQWADVELISGGTPCQDLSHAGRRAGMTEGTRSNLWVAMREAIATIRPALVVWENVRGAYSAAADSSMECCPGCVGATTDDGEPVLRALGRVLGDLSSLGYDALWYGLRASDVGAAHHRYRVFVFAFPADTGRDGREIPWAIGRGPALATVAGDRLPAELMPTPVVNDMGDGKTPEWWAEFLDRSKASTGNGNGHGKSLAMEAQLLPSPRTSDTNGAGAGGDGGPDLRTAVTFLPTTTAMDYKASGGGYNGQTNVTLTDATARYLPTARAGDGTKGGPNQRGSSGDLMLPSAVQDWREYEPAIRRQEAAFGRPAPLPTEPGKTGKPRLSARFSEWLMGCPDGWITDVPGITRNEALKAAGNGVVPQQCAAAATRFVHDFAAIQERAA